ncbi:hypothetical protein A4X03_0g6386 [Tilletia caries]|uniref:Uncharacterized protein n=1 Tax=Tilletia caries TaxID=13290 RepID=A0A8T8SYH2_9BASI|nr:hypothetical protein A4X03_0g6386 [Tilletia caries]
MGWHPNLRRSPSRDPGPACFAHVRPRPTNIDHPFMILLVVSALPHVQNGNSVSLCYVQSSSGRVSRLRSETSMGFMSQGVLTTFISTYSVTLTRGAAQANPPLLHGKQ